LVKLRIRDDSIRLRLTQQEVRIARSEGVVRGTVRFGGGSRFDYVLEGSPDAAAASAAISPGALTVTVPQGDLHRWADSETVSLAASQPIADEALLTILIEKDFACLAPREGEDETDMYPHPEAGNANC
jgi:hypothetical protein